MTFQEITRRMLCYLQEVDVYILKSLYDESLNLRQEEYEHKAFNATRCLDEAINQKEETYIEISPEEIAFPVPEKSKSFQQIAQEIPLKFGSETLKKRLEKMIEEGVVRSEADIYRLSPVGQDIVDLYKQMKEFFCKKSRPTSMAKSEYGLKN